MRTLYFLLYLVAAICFFVAAFIQPKGQAGTRVHLVAAGLFAWVLVPLIAQAQLLDD